MLEGLPAFFKDHFPFILATGQVQQLSMTRLLEAVIIAFISSAVTTYSITVRLDERTVYVVDTLKEIKSHASEQEKKIDSLNERQSDIRAKQAEMLRRMSATEEDIRELRGKRQKSK